MDRSARIGACTLSALGFVLGEAAVGWLRAAPGLEVRAQDAAVSLAALATIAVLVGALPRGERIFPLLLLAVSAPRAARLGEIDLLGPALIGVGLALAALAPRAALGLAALSGALAPTLMPLPIDRPAATVPVAPARDVLLLTIDTLRADAPLALPDGDWLRFEQAIAPAPWTLPSMYSVSVGAPVRRPGGGLRAGEGYSSPDQTFVPLAQRFSEAGYQTGAFICNPHLRAELGFDQGFQRFDHADAWVEPLTVMDAISMWRHRLGGPVERLRQLRDPLLVDAALRWWGQRSGPRFAWVHLLLPHEYQRDARGGHDRASAYAANVRATNAEIRRLVGGVGTDTAIAITSDHGESLGESGLWGHGSALNDEQLRVPLALRGFGAGRIERQVALTDLADALVGLDPEPLVRGRSVVEVGALRRDSSAWATRADGGTYTPRVAPASAGGATQPLSPELLHALEALGYTTD